MENQLRIYCGFDMEGRRWKNPGERKINGGRTKAIKIGTRRKTGRRKGFFLVFVVFILGFGNRKWALGKNWKNQLPVNKWKIVLFAYKNLCLWMVGFFRICGIPISMQAFS